MNDTIAEFVAEQGIKEVVHFTTNNGLLGVLASGELLSRDHLNEDQHLGSVKLLNCEIRRDPSWTDYISMSISTVNNSMLGTSKGWHDTPAVWWAVLSFDPSILEHEGVVFTTTNNVYEPTVKRGTGVAGLKAMFAPTVKWGYFDTSISRRQGHPTDQPTHHQAEVLYPGRLPLEFLRAVYVPKPEHMDEIEAWLGAFSSVPRVPVVSRPEVFG